MTERQSGEAPLQSESEPVVSVHQQTYCYQISSQEVVFMECLKKKSGILLWILKRHWITKVKEKIKYKIKYKVKRQWKILRLFSENSASGYKTFIYSADIHLLRSLLLGTKIDDNV